VRPGENAFADCILRLRKEVFIDYLGWPLKVDSEGREIDSFDNEHAEYSAVVSKGEIMAFGRLLPTEKKSLLFDVFGELIEYPDMIERGPAVWEGTRLAVHPKLTAEEAPKWFSKLIRDSALRKANEGVKYFCSVSDPIMERILKRTGITVARLGSSHRYDNGVTVVGLRLDCVSDQDKILPFLPQAAQLPTVSNTKH
jgi:N-acyl-L-homoserine lactone synthetase